MGGVATALPPTMRPVPCTKYGLRRKARVGNHHGAQSRQVPGVSYVAQENKDVAGAGAGVELEVVFASFFSFLVFLASRCQGRLVGCFPPCEVRSLFSFSYY